jgi:hypothetical protein
MPKVEKSISRLLLMSYFPSGFWSRLITRILADEQVVEALRCLYPLPSYIRSGTEFSIEYVFTLVSLANWISLVLRQHNDI